MLILIPVLYVIGMAIKNTEAIKDKFIPLILGGASIVLAFLMLITSGATDILSCIVAAVTQGVLCAGASVYVNQIIKQSKGDK